MRFGINSFLVSPAFGRGDMRLIGQFKSWGADFIEFAVHDPGDVDAAELKQALSDAGMANCPVCGIFPPDRDLRGDRLQQRAAADYMMRLIDLAAAIGSRVVAGPFYSCVGRSGMHSAAEREEQAELVAGHIRALCRHAEGAGVVLCMEPLNRFETDFINTLGQAADLIGRVGHPALRIHADTFHMHIEEDDPAAALRENAPLLGHVHASASHRGIPGRDQVDWDRLFTALREAGYTGDAAIETFSSGNATIARAASIWIQRFDSPEQLVREGLAFLRGAWARAEAEVTA